ncbi:MAG: CdaA regulatory protein CdaR [Anaerolineales bacterium]|nr:CdaA regulatory protein CdaR [Anaerolineales bacterium]
MRVIFRWIANNYRTFLWAFALAVAVWISSVTSADPDQTRSISSPAPIEIIGQSSNLVFSKPIPSSVELTLRAPSSVWKLIDADPQIVRAILDVSGLSAGEHTVELQIQVNARPVQTVSVAPQAVTFTLEPLITKTLEVDLRISGEAAVGYQVGESSLEPDKIVVSGAQSQVEKVSRARVSADLNSLRESFDQFLKVEALDERGQPVSGVSVSPEIVRVIMPISQQGGYRDVAVKVTMLGRVASGYRLTDISVSPPVVTIYSEDPDLVNSLPGVLETQPLDLQNAKEDIATRLKLSLLPGISIVGEPTVLVQAGVSPIESSVTLSGQRIEIVGLESDLNAQVSPTSVDIILSGPLPILDTLTRQSVRVTVDLTGFGAGTYQLTPIVQVLVDNIVAESILPNTVEVSLTPLEQGAPTSTSTP